MNLTSNNIIIDKVLDLEGDSNVFYKFKEAVILKDGFAWSKGNAVVPYNFERGKPFIERVLLYLAKDVQLKED